MTTAGQQPPRNVRPAGRGPVRAAAAALAVGTVLAVAACSSGGASVESASTGVSGSSEAPSSAASALSSSAATARSGIPVSPTSSATATSSGGDSGGAAYCESKGGDVQTRDATFGTNGDQTGWLPLAGTTQVCRFQADDEARSRIYVDFATLTSARPTLAGLAYLSRPPVPTSSGGANPATGYCTKLGGSSTFGEISASGGGWVNKDDPDDIVVNLCVFPDESFIDEWGLAYHAGGVVRGQDLTQVMTYQPPDPLPGVFPMGTPTGQPTVGVTGSPSPSSTSTPTS